MKTIYWMHTTCQVLTALGALGALALSAGPVQAQGGLVIQALNSTAASGGTGSFDVVLRDIGGTFNVSGFSFEPTVSGASGVAFTAADVNTTSAPYIFGTYQSGPAPFSFNTFPNTDFIASDASMTAPFVTTLTTGSTFGLGHVTYSVAAGTLPGSVPVNFVPGGTSLSDVNGDAIPFTSVNGTITVVPAVPEASTTVSLGLLLALGVGGLAVTSRRKRANVKASV